MDSYISFQESQTHPRSPPPGIGDLIAKGVKIAISLEDGYVRIEKLSRVVFTESQPPQNICERYRERHGYYPGHVQKVKICRTRDTLNYCNDHDIRLNDSKLGRLLKDRILYEK